MKDGMIEVLNDKDMLQMVCRSNIKEALPVIKPKHAVIPTEKMVNADLLGIDVTKLGKRPVSPASK